MFQRMKRVFTAVIIGALVYLFIVPSLYLRDLTGQLDLSARAALAALDVGEPPGAHLRQLRQTLEQEAGTLRLFLDHDAVDALAASVAALEPLTQPEDIRSAVAAVRSELEHLKSIESFDWHTLL